jgi:hypothetical protein
MSEIQSDPRKAMTFLEPSRSTILERRILIIGSLQQAMSQAPLRNFVWLRFRANISALAPDFSAPL